jgi:hypothetical protein
MITTRQLEKAVEDHNGVLQEALVALYQGVDLKLITEQLSMSLMRVQAVVVAFDSQEYLAQMRTKG